MTSTATPSGDALSLARIWANFAEATEDGTTNTSNYNRAILFARALLATTSASEIGPKENAAPQGTAEATPRQVPSPAVAASDDKPVPRTDALLDSLDAAWPEEHQKVTAMYEHARQLERELADAYDDVARLHRDKMDLLFGPDGKPRSAIEAIPEEFAQLAKFYDVQDMAALVRVQEERIERMRQQLPKPRGPESDPQNYRRG